LFGIAPGVQMATSYLILSRQAQPFAQEFFGYLREGSPQKAMMLKFAPDYRQSLDDGLWVFYRHDLEGKKALKEFVANPAVRALLALGDKAQVRLYKVAAVGT